MRRFVADTLALVAFFTLTGIANERLVAGMGWAEVAQARAIGAPLMVLTARPYGVWRDRLLRGRRRRALWDTVALMSFQVPLYAAVIWAGGADGAAILRGTLGGAAVMLVAGRPYGLWLDWVRARFGLPPGGDRPMSLEPRA